MTSISTSPPRATFSEIPSHPRPQGCADALGISRRYLERLFAERDSTVAGFVREQRLLRCRDALRAPSERHRSVCEIAFGWGFSSASHFSRAFRARFGVSPSAARREQTHFD